MMLGLSDSSRTNESPRRRRERLEAAFDDEVYRRLIEHMQSRFATRAFWLDLCPEMTSSDEPFVPTPARPTIPKDLAVQCEEMIALDGYFLTPPIVQSEDAAKVGRAISRLAAEGYPTGFVAVFDEFWRLFYGLESLLRPVLGDDYLMVPDGLWAFFVPPGDPGLSGWSSLGPHRDSIGPDAHLVTSGRPGLVNIWIALTDANPLNSCLYVLPASIDDDYLDRMAVSSGAVSLQDIRALPVEAGSVLGWTSHLLHWGGRSSPTATMPRMSVALYLQRRDVKPYASDTISFNEPIPFEKRLQWIANATPLSHLFSP
jgi:hypothetical protein